MPMFLVTGNQGFIGRHLQERLENDGHEVFGIDLLGDYDVFKTLERVPWQQIEKIYHLGAITDTRVCDIDIMLKFNVEFSKKIITCAEHFHIPIHYASSSAVYGNSRDNKPNPLNQYAMSKLMIDYYVRDHKWTTNIVGFRLFNVYGMDERKKDRASLVNKLIHAKNPAIFKASAAYFRDFVCVEDVVEVLIKTYKDGIYDIGTGTSENLLELAEAITKYTGRDFSMIPMPKELKPQYQEYTKAMFRPDELDGFKYKSVGEWLWDNQIGIANT
jgi:ADP-L-glycero-D-manno-heptose 6-epimerase